MTPQAGDTISTIELWRAEIVARFSDMDAQGHINNLAYLGYIQECRVQWIRSLELGSKYETVIVNTNIDYLQELVYPVTVCVILSGAEPGRSSLLTRYEIWTQGKDAYQAARAQAKIVFIDPQKRKSVPMPDNVRKWFT